MLLVLDDRHKENLSLLSNMDDNVSSEFCKISMQFVLNGINYKMLQTAAQKLKLDGETVKKIIESLMFLFVESSKLMLTEIDFNDSFLILGLPDALNSTLLDLFLTNRIKVRETLSKLSFDLPHYHDLEWRLDVQIGSRSLNNQVSPAILLDLHTKDGDSNAHRILQTDPVNLVHITNVLEHALSEMKTAHCRRITRNIK